MKKEIINLKGPGVRLGGEFKYKLWNEDGSLAAESDWSDNLITNNGLIIYTTDAWFNDFSIGSGTNTAAITDTSLQAWRQDYTGSVGGDIFVTGSSPNWEASSTKTRRFGPDGQTGTINEFGVNRGSNGTNIFSRFNVIPGISKNASQTLDVSYRLTRWPSLIDVVNNDVSIGGELYDTLTSWYRGDYPGTGIFNLYNFYSVDSFYNTWDGLKADLSQSSPSGDVGPNNSTRYNGAGGSGFRDGGIVLGLNDGVTDTEFVRTAGGAAAGPWPFNTQFTATTGPNIGSGIPKDLTQQLTLNWQLTWARK